MFKAILLAVGTAALLAPLAWWSAADLWPRGQPPTRTSTSETKPSLLEAPVCIGCGDARHPTRRLNENDFRELMRSYAAEPETGGPALDSLCYYGPQVNFMLDAVGASGVDDARVTRLRRELARDHVYFSVRVIDERGHERLTLKRSYTPFDANVHHRLTQINDCPPCEISGTLKRVGLHHIWARF